ncbi:MAG: hypothetical protein WDO73_17430 [Ignavibacteriota bacterium]
MKLTRRQLATMVSAAAMAGAQTAQPPAPVDELQAARERLKTNSDIVAKLDVPAATEPAFRFRA